MRYGSVEVNFGSHVWFVPETGCIEWMGYRDKCGYGRLRTSTGRISAHRVAWTLSGRTLTPGLEIDHLCRVRHCVNPDHLEEVTHGDNVMRGVSPAALNATKSRCPRGHPLTGAVGSRRCKVCDNARKRRNVADRRSRGLCIACGVPTGGAARCPEHAARAARNLVAFRARRG